MDIAKELVDYAVGLNFDDLPAEVVDCSKKVILDTLAAVILGSEHSGTEAMVDIISDWGGKQESSILIFGPKVPAPLAALINCSMARAHDFDEFHQTAMLHSAASIVPACLAIAERAGGVDGKDFISAVVAGIDIMNRLGLSLERSPLVTGMASTSHLASFGVAVAAGKLLRMDRKELIHAMGIAYSQVSGTVLPSIEGSLMVHIQIGMAAQAGILSAVLAKGGIDGPQGMLEGKFGYFHVYHQNRYNPAVVVQDLGKRFEITNVSIKYFPCCLCSHAAISAILNMASEEPIDPRKIDLIRVGVTQGVYNIVCHPLENTRNPPSVKKALFSLPYTVAAALVRGHLSLEDFSLEAVLDPQVRIISNKITPYVDEAIEKEYGRTLGPAVVEVIFRNGRKRTCRVDFVKGHPRNPMTMEDCEEKFRNCFSFSARPLSAEKASALLKAVKDLDRINDVSQIVNYLK